MGNSEAGFRPLVTSVVSVPEYRVKRFHRRFMTSAKKSAAVTSPDISRATLAIGRLARAAGVGVETIRYYQRRGLLPAALPAAGVRRYELDLVHRVHFIKHAQSLGFTLDEVASLLALQDGQDRSSVRDIAAARLEQIDAKLAALSAMSGTLNQLLLQCAQDDGHHCYPIIACLADDVAAPSVRAAQHDGARGGHTPRRLCAPIPKVTSAAQVIGRRQNQH